MREFILRSVLEFMPWHMPRSALEFISRYALKFMSRSASKSALVAFRLLKFRLFKFLPTPLSFATALDLSRQIASVGRAQQRAAPARASFVRTQKERAQAVKFLNFNVALFFIMRAKFYAPEFCAPAFLAPWFSPLEFCSKPHLGSWCLFCSSLFNSSSLLWSICRL